MWRDGQEEGSDHLRFSQSASFFVNGTPNPSTIAALMRLLGRARQGFYIPHLHQSRALGATLERSAKPPLQLRAPRVLKTPGFPLVQMHAAPPYKGTPARAFRRPFAPFTFHVCLSGRESKQAFLTTILGSGRR